MKILHVCKKYPQALGGDSVVVSNLQACQESAGHQVSVLTSNCPQILSGPHIYKFGLRDTPAALDNITGRRLMSLIMLPFKAFRVIYRERPEVIHSHSIDMAFFVAPIARLFKIPLIHTFHIVTFYDEHQSWLRRKSEIWLARHAHLSLVTAPNEYDACQLRAAGLKQAVTLPNGVDLDFWQLKSKKMERKGIFTFVSVGRLEAQKGYEYLIKATSQLKAQTHRPFRIIIIGEGGDHAKLSKLASELAVKNIEFLGRRSPEQTRDLLASSNAAIFPSLYETTPLTLLEAWALELPVIITNVGIMRNEFVNRRNAYVVRPRDDQALMGAMRSCLEDDEMRTEVAVCGQQTVQQYAWPDIAKTAEKLYGSIV